jgi:phospholipase/carboxylesterase
LGADGHDFIDLVPALSATTIRRVRFVFPHAPIRPVTINAGIRMRAWYDIADASFSESVDETGIAASQRLLRSRIDEEIARGIASDRIVVAGFSQGGVIALRTGTTYPVRLGGIIALSTYFVPPPAPDAPAVEEPRRIFMAHGLEDPLIPIGIAQRSREALLSRGHDVQWHSYHMPHAVCPAEIRDLGEWLSQVLE